MYLVQELSGDGRPSAGAKDTAIIGAYLSYPFSLSLVVVGSLFYISIIHSYSTEIAGLLPLLSAIFFLLDTIFSSGYGRVSTISSPLTHLGGGNVPDY